MLLSSSTKYMNMTALIGNAYIWSLPDTESPLPFTQSVSEQFVDNYNLKWKYITHLHQNHLHQITHFLSSLLSFWTETFRVWTFCFCPFGERPATCSAFKLTSLTFQFRIAWPNTFCNSNKYSSQFRSQAMLLSTCSVVKLISLIFSIWTNIFINFDKYSLKFKQIHFST